MTIITWNMLLLLSADDVDEVLGLTNRLNAD